MWTICSRHTWAMLVDCMFFSGQGRKKPVEIGVKVSLLHKKFSCHAPLDIRMHAAFFIGGTAEKGGRKTASLLLATVKGLSLNCMQLTDTLVVSCIQRGLINSRVPCLGTEMLASKVAIRHCMSTTIWFNPRIFINPLRLSQSPSFQNNK